MVGLIYFFDIVVFVSVYVIVLLIKVFIGVLVGIIVFGFIFFGLIIYVGYKFMENIEEEKEELL